MIDSINPTFKTLAILLVTILISIVNAFPVNVLLIILAALAIVSSKQFRLRSFLKLLLPALLLALSFFFSGWKMYAGEASGLALSDLDFGHAVLRSPSLENGLELGTRVLAFAFLGLCYRFTTDPMELLASFRQQLGMTRSMAYGILASFHMIPTLRKEYQKSKLALRVRNIRVIPILDTKAVLSMMTRIVRYSDQLALAMEGKGFSENASSFIQTRVRARDYIFLFGLPLLLLGTACFLK